MNAIAMRVVSLLTRLLFIGLTLIVSPAFAQIYHAGPAARGRGPE